MPDPIDPSGFNMYARLVVADGGGTFDLWMRGADGIDGDSYDMNPSGFWRGGDSGIFIDLPILQSVDIEMNLGLNGKINLEVGAPFDLGIALLESQLFTIGNQIQVQLVYPKTGRSTPWFGGMTVKPSIRLDPDSGLSATLNAVGGGFAALRSVSSEPFANQTYRQIIQTIADRHEWEVIQPDVGNFTADNPDPYETTRVTVSQGNMSDYLFLRHVATQANLDFWLGPGGGDSGNEEAVHLYRRESLLASRPRFTFVARGKSDFVNTFPLFNFETQQDTLWLPPGAGLLRSGDINPEDRAETQVEVDPATNSTTANAPAQVGDGSVEVDGRISRARLPPDAQTSGEWYASSSRDPTSTLERMRSHSTAEGMRSGIGATISSFGIPDLVPGNVIRIEELGIFSGNYGIQGLTHHAAAGEWTMQMTLLSNGAAVSAIAENLRQAPLSFNREEPEEPPAAAGGGTTVEPRPVGDNGGTT